MGKESGGFFAEFSSQRLHFGQCQGCEKKWKDVVRKRFQSVIVLYLALAGLCFAPTSALALPPGEEARVEAMLSVLEKRSDVVFIRNGSEHSAAEAAKHLRLKLNKTRDRLSNAEEFIDKVGSSSSLSGSLYQVREKGQPPRPAGDFLHEILR